MKVHRFLVALSSTVAVPLIASAMLYGSGFSDVPDDVWYTPHVMDAVSLGIASGYRDTNGNLTGKFGPEHPVTFAEALKIALESAGFDVNLGQGSGHWAARYLSIAIGEHFSLAPNQYVSLDRAATRAEVASLFADAFRVSIIPSFTPVFSDVSASNRFAFEIAALHRDGILSGDTGTDGEATGLFRPASLINRAEVVKIAIVARNFYRQRSSASSSSRSGSFSSFSGAGTCTLNECGYAPGMPNWQCPDGTLGGPSCERLPDTSTSLSAGSRCGWLIRQCAVSSRSSSSSSSHSSSSSSSSSVQTAVTVLYTSSGFTPSVVHVGSGQTVIFKNTVTDDLRVSSNPHPNHTDYPGFDSGFSVPKDGEYFFTFRKKGTWGYHNHFSPNRGGQVIVE